jgi:RNA polymerase sigma factor (sigma-70 family)
MAYKPEIYQKFLRGDIAGAELIYMVYLKPLSIWGCKYVSRYDAIEDAVADTFRLMMERIGTFKDGDHIHKWLFAVVRNKCWNEARVLRKVAVLPEGLEDMSDFNTQELLDIKDQNLYIQARIAIIRDKLQRLPKNQRQDFYAHFFGLKTFPEIAGERGRAEITVRQNVDRAAKKIQKLLKKS